MVKSKNKKAVTIVVVLISVIVTLLYIALYKPKDISSKIPNTINIDSKYYLKRIALIDYPIIDCKNQSFIFSDTSAEDDFSMGLLSLDGNVIISPIYKDLCFVTDDTIKGWRTETDVYYFSIDGSILAHGDYEDLKDTYEVPMTFDEPYSVLEFQSTVYSEDEDGNPKKILGKYVVYGSSQEEIVFPKNVEFKDVTIANITGKVFVGDVYDEIYYYSHQDNIALVKKGDDVYYCDTDGNPIFYVECNFHEDENGNPCFARKGFSELFPIYMFNHGYAITVKNDKYGLINLEGKTIIDFNYDKLIELPYNLYIAIQGDSVAICDIALNTGLVSDYFKNIQSCDDYIILYDDNTNQSLVYSIEMNL